MYKICIAPIQDFWSRIFAENDNAVIVAIVFKLIHLKQLIAKNMILVGMMISQVEFLLACYVISPSHPDYASLTQKMSTKFGFFVK